MPHWAPAPVPGLTQKGLTWVPLLHREGIDGLVEDGQVVIDVLRAEEVLSPGASGAPTVQPPQSQTEKLAFPLTKAQTLTQHLLSSQMRKGPLRGEN